MAAAYLDSQLELLLRKSFIADEHVAKELLDASKPLGTFSSRIDLTFAVGQLPRLVHRDLHLIRKIRNDFGHNPQPIDFAEPRISARCRELTHTFHDESEAPRRRFTNAVMGVLAFIHIAIHRQEQPHRQADISDRLDRRNAFISTH
jgi:DNA-binding MltR family transcriptional regulator